MDGSLTPVVCIIQNEFGTEWVIIEDPSEEEVGEEKKRRKSCIHQFCERIFHEEGDIYQQTVGMAGHVIFDFNFFVSILKPYTQETPKILWDGTSILKVKMYGTQITFIDSFRFIPFKLEDFPQAFDLEEEEANGFFPYAVSNYLYWNKRIDKPNREDFDPQFMSKEKRIKFEKWYEEEIEKPFLASEALVASGELDHNCYYDVLAENVKYCRSDVNILQEGFLKFFNTMYDATGVMPAFTTIPP